MWIRNWYERMISLEYGFFQPLPIVIPQFIKAIRLDDGELFRGLLGEMSTRFHRAIEGGHPRMAFGPGRRNSAHSTRARYCSLL